jgi:DtxR family Mn-dependent transcriptional regulator
MSLSESAQELLESLWVATEEKAKVGLEKKDPQPEEVDELIRLGLAEWRGKWLVLTPAGRPEATRAIRRHRLGERLLADVLTTEDALLDEHACRLEHALFDGIDESICTLLGHPRFCPHGKPIPPGKCCRQRRASVGRLIAPLCQLQPGQGGHIAYIQMNNPPRLRKLMAMGVLPGVPIRLLRKFPSIVFEASYSQFAVDEEIAAAIYVRLNHE